MKKNLMSIFGALIFITVANADSNTKGFYLGVGYGNMQYSDDRLASSDLDNKNSGTKLYAGFQFNKMMGIELSHIDYGEYKSYRLSQKFSETRLAVNVGRSFIDAQLRPFVNLGLGLIKRDITGGYVYQIDDGGVALALGLGLQYEPKSLDGVGVRIGYDFSYFEQEIRGGYYVEDKLYVQSLGMTYISLQYKF